MSIIYVIICTTQCTMYWHCLSADPYDYTSNLPYIVTFPKANVTEDDAGASVMSLPILINITNDDVLEGVEFIQICIMVTAHNFSVMIGPQDLVNVTIVDDDSKCSISLAWKMYLVRKLGET